MGIRKENDWVGINLSNPGFTNTDFKDAGVNINNTSIGPESAYINNPQIRQDEQFQTSGKFDLAKFHIKYVELAKSYNDLAKDTYTRDLKGKGRIFAENDIFVSPEERRLSSDAFMTLINNPDHISYGIVGIDLPGPRTKTPMELAEGHPIFDSLTGKFTEDTPEDSFFKYFWRPKMMATWDYNADINGNPTDDPTKIAYLKGEYKLTEDGEYYTEFVNGRSTYGKEIVSHWNILTKEDSALNKYDPFDSDDIKKSTAGSIARNALKILPLLTPVAPYYAMASIGINLVDALGTLGKLVVGSENPTLNNITAFSEQFNLTVSEEGMQHTFGTENILNMIGDTFLFLKSLRILAEQAPKLFMSETAEIMKNPQARIGELAGSYTQALRAAINAKYSELEKGVSDILALLLEKEKELTTVASIATTRASAIVNNQIQNFHKLGRQISTSMMAITFGLHTYGAAKAQGVTDEAATALTLGAIAGLYALLGSHIGLKIFPEANVLRALIRKSLETWLGGNVEGGFKASQEAMENAVGNEAKQLAMSSMFKKGVNLAKQIWDVLETIGGTVVASTAATGIEMMSFTALDDLIASTYNLASWLSGSDHRMVAWNDIAGRYGSALLGGAIAGAMGARDIYRNAKAARDLNTLKAFELLVYMINEGKEGDIIREIDKHDWGITNLSTEVVARRLMENGEYEDLYGTPSEENSLSDEVKKVMKLAIYDLKSILTTYGAKISKDSLLDVMVDGKNITKDLRLAVLKQSSYAQYYLDRFIKNQIKIYDNARELSVKPEAKLERNEQDSQTKAINQEVKDYENSIEPPAELKTKKQTGDELTAPLSPEASAKIKAKKELKDALELNRKFLNGEMRAEFIDKALFEMQTGLNAPYIDAAFRDYVKNSEGGTEFEDVSLAQKRKLAKDFYQANTGAAKMDLIDRAYDKFMQATKAISKSLKELLNKENNKNLDDFLSVFKTENIAIRNTLYGLINPYEDILESIYKLTLEGESNTPKRPENIWAREEFARYTPMKETFDLLFLIDSFIERYKNSKEGVFSGNKEAMEAILELRTLFNDLGLYKKFLLGLKFRAELAKADYKLKVDEALAKGEPQPTDGPEFVFNSETIASELAKHYLGTLRLETIDETKKEPTVERAIPEERVFKMFENMDKAIERFKAEGKSVPADKLLTIKDFMMSPDFLEDPEMNIERSIAQVINILTYKTIGELLLQELENILPEHSYIDDYSKELLLKLIGQFLKILVYYDGLQGSGVSLNDLRIDIPGTSSKTNFIKMLASIAEEGGVYGNIATLVDSIFDINNNTFLLRLLLTTRFNNIKSRIENINPDGILDAADRLKAELGIRGGSIKELMQKIDHEVSKKTSEFTGFSSLTPQRIKANEIIFSPEILDEINAAILVLLMMRSGYAASADEVKTVFNHVGFAVTHNKILEENKQLNDENKLTVITLEHANDGIEHITDFIYKLMYWREVAANALKLRTEISDLADLGLRINLMELISKKIDLLDSNIWKGIAEFRNDISNLTTVQGLWNALRDARILGASKETKEKVLRELFLFKKALHNFFKKNRDNVDSPEKLATFINLDNFKLTSKIHAINLEDKLLDESGLMWFMASACALDPDVYASNLKEALSGRRLPIELLDIWKYEGAAFTFYRSIFDKFANALVYSVSARPEYKDLNSTDPEKKKAAKIEFAKKFLNSAFNPRRRNIQLISSGAGFGKSTFVPEFITLLKNLDPTLDINTNFWIAGPEDTKSTVKDSMAIKMRQECGGETTPTFTRDSLMRKIVKDFDGYEARFKVTNGRLQISDGEKLTVNLETGALNIDVELNDGITNLPRIIILDEVSDYSTFDLDIIDNFAKKNNIAVIALGDFTQSGVYGTIKVDFGDGTTIDNVLGSSDTEFIRTFKSLLTFRTENVLTEKNNSIVRSYIDHYLDYVLSKGKVDFGNDLVLKLYYHFDDKTGALYGTKVLTPPAEGEELSDEAKKYIDGMYRSLQNNLTITLLYTDETSPVYNYINKHAEWLKKTDLRQGTTLKSSENTYYIIDLDNKLDTSDVIDNANKDWGTMERLSREFYTALTRQKQGSLFFDRFSNKLEKFLVENHLPDPDTLEIAMPKQFIEERAANFKALLDELFPNQLKLSDADEAPKRVSPPRPEGTTIDTDTNRQVDMDNIEHDGDLDSEEMFKRKSEQGDDDLDRKHDLDIKVKDANKPFEYMDRNYPTTHTPASIVDEQIYYTMYTFNAQRSGFRVDGTLDLRTDRRDVVYGLLHIHNQLMLSTGGRVGIIRDPDTLMPIDFSTLDTTKPLPQHILDTVIGLLTKIQSLAWTADNKTIVQELKSILNIPDELSIRYLVLNRLNTMPDPNKVDPLIDIDRTLEFCWGAKGDGKNNGEINRTELVLFIGKNSNNPNVEDDVLLTVPVATFPNYATIIEKSNGHLDNRIVQEYNNLKINRNLNGFQKAEAMYKWLQPHAVPGANNIPGAAALLKTLEIFLANTSTAFYLPDFFQLAKLKTDDKTRGAFENLGWFMNTSLRGFDYSTEGYELGKFDLTPVETILSEPDKDISKIYVAYPDSNKLKYVTNGNGTSFYSGGYYILIANKGVFRNIDGTLDEAEMFKYFSEQLSDPTKPTKVKAMLVRPPKATFQAFIDSEFETLYHNRDGGLKLDVGNQFTILRILLNLITLDENESFRETAFRDDFFSEARLNAHSYNEFKKGINFIAGLNAEGDLKYSNIKSLIHKLTYLEGKLSEERRNALGVIYENAESKLTPAEKTEMDTFIEKSVTKNYVSTLCEYLTIKELGDSFNNRNKLRYFLQHLWDPARAKDQIFDEYNKLALQDFIRVAAKDLAILYNPEFNKDPINPDGVEIIDTNGNRRKFTFHLVINRSLQGLDNFYRYKDLPFMYASRLLLSPLVGNITNVIDSVLKLFNPTLYNGRIYINNIPKWSTAFEKRNIFSKRLPTVKHYFIGNIKNENGVRLNIVDTITMDNINGVPTGIYALDFEDNKIAFFKEDAFGLKPEEKVIDAQKILYSSIPDFDKDKLDTTNTFVPKDKILRVSVLTPDGETTYKYYMISKESRIKKLIDVTKKEQQYNPLAQEFNAKTLELHNYSFSVLISKDGRVKLYTPMVPINDPDFGEINQLVEYNNLLYINSSGTLLEVPKERYLIDTPDEIITVSPRFTITKDNTGTTKVVNISDELKYGEHKIKNIFITLNSITMLLENGQVVRDNDAKEYIQHNEHALLPYVESVTFPSNAEFPITSELRALIDFLNPGGRGYGVSVVSPELLQEYSGKTPEELKASIDMYNRRITKLPEDFMLALDKWIQSCIN